MFQQLWDFLRGQNPIYDSECQWDGTFFSDVHIDDQTYQTNGHIET